jgi:transcriptional regulator with XRE-family HTH domain
VKRKRNAPDRFDRTIDANQIVGANFRLARELKGWTQEEAARKLAPYLGQLLPKASISAIERVLDRERRRVFNAQELLAFAAAFDVPMWWFFLPVPGSENMRLEGVGDRASDLLVYFLGRQDQLEMLKSQAARIRSGTDRSAIDEVLEKVFGAPSWRHWEATRMLALQEFAYQEASTIEQLIGALREVVAKFDGVFERALPENIEQAAFMEWLPSQVYRRTSEVLLGKEFWRRLFDWESPSRPRLDLLLNRRDLPLEEWIDTDDPVLVERAAALFDRIEEQLAEKEMPPPPEEAVEAS